VKLTVVTEGRDGHGSGRAGGYAMRPANAPLRAELNIGFVRRLPERQCSPCDPPTHRTGGASPRPDGAGLATGAAPESPAVDEGVAFSGASPIRSVRGSTCRSCWGGSTSTPSSCGATGAVAPHARTAVNASAFHRSFIPVPPARERANRMPPARSTRRAFAHETGSQAPSPTTAPCPIRLEVYTPSTNYWTIGRRRPPWGRNFRRRVVGIAPAFSRRMTRALLARTARDAG
jgi:hypothetical protein